MKSTKILYWIFTILFAGFMIFSAIPDIMVTQQAVDIVSTALGYPHYFIAYIGWAKLIGAIAILVPGFPRVKEWAYAGLMFDLVSATYSMIVKAFDIGGLIFMIVLIAAGACSYIFYHKKLRLAAAR